MPVTRKRRQHLPASSHHRTSTAWSCSRRLLHAAYRGNVAIGVTATLTHNDALSGAGECRYRTLQSMPPCITLHSSTLTLTSLTH
jgi:hypothetical protein